MLHLICYKQISGVVKYSEVSQKQLYNNYKIGRCINKDLAK